VLERLAEVLVRDAGYRPDAVIRDYAFADYLGPGEVVRRVELAAFSEVPPSYRSACVAAARLPEERVGPTLDELRALGAPRVITLGPRRAEVWALSGAADPQRIDDCATEEIAEVIRTSAADWSPMAMSRLGGLAPTGTYQLDFSDVGLIPMIERQVNEKIDRLIREVLAGCLEQDGSLAKSPRRYRQLVRMGFQLLAAKVLADRAHPGVDLPLADAREALRAAQRHYGLRASSEGDAGPIKDSVRDWAWGEIQRGFHFQNLSVDSLAFVYENSLVSPEVRRRLGIHGTPRAIAELVVALLPLEDLPGGRDVILEPCAGFAPFLLAAMRRLRAHALGSFDPDQRHVSLVHRLRGVELDPFAVEVGRLCLTLADYPNADGWELAQDDVFNRGVLEGLAPGVGAVLANPPFEALTQEDRQRYGALRAEQPAELLRRVLEVCQPELLGFVLPRVAIDSSRGGYLDLHRELRRTYREIDVVDLPDTLFEHSGAESALLVARGRRQGPETTLRSAHLQPADTGAALEGRWVPKWSVESVVAEGARSASLRVKELAEVWKRLEHLPKLGQVAEVHRGIEYRRSVHDLPGGPTSEGPRPGYALGAYSARDIEPYRLARTLYLKVKRDEIKAAGDHPWTQPKVIVNAVRRRRGWWRLTAAPDRRGRWCYQNLTAIWPKDTEDWPIELTSAVLNGPIANAWLKVSGGRHVRRESLMEIPMPEKNRLDVRRIIELVREASERLALDIMIRIDAEVLIGYDLPPRLERQVLSLFEGEDRPGAPDFSRYYPRDFDSALPLHRVLTDLGGRSRATRLLETVPIFHNEAITEVLDRVAVEFDG
jgi:N-6 DNA Methylase